MAILTTQGFSTFTYSYAGGSLVFNTPFALGVLSPAHVQAFVVGEVDGLGDQLYHDCIYDAITGDTTVVGPLPNPSDVTIQRTVPKDALFVSFASGADVTKTNIDIAVKYTLMALHETLDGRWSNVAFDALTAAVNAAIAAQAAAEAAAYSAAVAAEADVVLADAAAAAAAISASQSAAAAAAAISASQSAAAATSGVVTRTALKALDTSPVATVYLREAGREGQFVWRTGDYTARIATDTQEGIFIKANAVAASAGAWVRAYSGMVNALWFGVVPDGRNGNTDNTSAVQAAVNVVIQNRFGELFFPGGSYGIGSTVTVALTDTTIAGRGVTCNIVGAGSDATEFFWLPASDAAMWFIKGPAGTNTNNLGGVQNLHWRGFSGHMLNQGRGTFISTQYIGHSKFEDIHSFEFLLHWQMIDALAVLMDRVRASNGQRGFYAYRNDFTFPNAYTFLQCTFGGMNEWGVMGEGISGWVFTGGSIEGNGASGTFAKRGGMHIVAPGNEGGLGLVIEGTYFEYNGGEADITISANAVFPSLHKIAGVFNRANSPANAAHNILVRTDTGYGAINVDYTGSAFVSFPGYVASGARLRMTKVGAGSVRFYGSAYFKDAVEAPAAADTGPIAEAQFNLTGVIARGSNVSSISKTAVGDYTLNLIQPKRGNAYIEVVTDGAIIASKFSESATAVRIRLYSTAAVLADPPSLITVRVFA